MSNCTSIAAAVSVEVTQGQADWRVLGIKIALYDELRERRISQPSGVDWAWASTDLPGRMEYPLCYRGDWHYDAIFITTDVLEASLRRSGGVPVGPRINGVSWRVNDPSVVVIMLGDNDDPTGAGRDLWVLSHLTYPMVWVLETFRMYKVGREGGADNLEQMDYSEEVFSRLAGQVDINLRKNKIMFIVPTKTRDSVTVGNAVFNVTSTDRWGQLPGENGPPVFDMDPHLVDIIERCLTSPRNLRAKFSDHARPYFSTGFNWVEIDTLITAILPRFHQRVEGNRATREEGRFNTGAPSDILEAYGLDPLPGLTPESFADYGAEHAVTAMDMRPTTRGRARRNPVMLIGCWTNMAEIAVGTGFGMYDVHNIDNYNTIKARLSAGAEDRLNRARYLRMACENIKRSIGVTDTVAFPRDDPGIIQYWPSIIGSPSSPPGTTMHWMAATLVAETVRWSWTVNCQIPPGGSTLTGARTVSGMWRNLTNTEFGPVSMTSMSYEHDTTINRWSNNFWLQLGQGEDKFILCENLN